VLYSGWVELLSIAWGVERPRTPPAASRFFSPLSQGPGGLAPPCRRDYRRARKEVGAGEILPGPRSPERSGPKEA
jgi:hypothetical protein